MDEIVGNVGRHGVHGPEHWGLPEAYPADKIVVVKYYYLLPLPTFSCHSVRATN